MNLNYLTHERGRKQAAKYFANVLPTNTGCLEWQGFKDEKGYGRFQLFTCMGRQQRAHRVAYLLHYGPFDPELVVRHSCNNPACVNPEHLELGTQLDNIQDRVRAGRSARGERPSNRGSKHGMSKLTEMDVHEVRALYPVLEMVLGKDGAYKTLATRLGVCRSNIQNIISGRSWAWLKSPVPAQVGGY